MKSLVSILFFLFLATLVGAQKNGNEWINFQQNYFSFKVYKDGVYKVDYTTLVNSGVNVSSFATENVQLFSREREVPIYFFDGGDNKLDSGEYFVFYGQKNDGWIDSVLYENATDICNPYYSLINDTINYFFTWNNKTDNLRYTYDSSTNYSSYSPTNYWLTTKRVINSSSYIQMGGSPFYLPGEGFSLSKDGVSSVASVDLKLVNTGEMYTGSDAPNALFESNISAFSNASYTGQGNHHVRFGLKETNYSIVDSVFTGVQFFKFQRSIPHSFIKNNQTLNWSIINDQGALTDYQGFSFMSLRFATNTTLSGGNSGVFTIKPSTSASKVRLDVKNTSITTPLALVLGSSPKYIGVSPNGAGNWQLLIPNANDGSDQELVLHDLTKCISISKLTPVNGTGVFTNYNLISSENAVIMVYPKTMELAASEYASYRTSLEGGSHNVILANIDELYLQYGGGVYKHFVGIRRFAKHMYDKSINKPISLFLIGKGITNSSMRNSVGNFSNCHIPTFGYPSSDVAFTGGYQQNWEPLIPTGRIAVSNDNELRNYLSKVKEYEANQSATGFYSSATKQWQKEVLHFSGGSTTQDQTTFQNYLASLEAIIRNKYFGAEVRTIKKSSSAPIDPVLLSSVTKQISEGVSLMTFFGHSNSSTFDVGVDDPSNWNNKGHYPVIIGNGCNSGDIFSNSYSYSERLLNTVDGGAIAFLSPSTLGYDANLFKYSSKLYSHFTYNSYGKSIGYQIKKTIADIYANNPTSIDEYTCFQMVLHGDPLLKINAHEKPELEITDEGIYFEPKKLTLSTDSVEMFIILKNLGKTIEDTFQLEVKRRFPKLNTDSTYLFSIPGLYFIDTFSFKFPLQANIGTGINYFDVSVDIPSFISEQFDEFGNNQVTKQFIIDIDGIIPTYPYEFAIVPEDSVVLKACTPNPIATMNTYRFELDTVDTYDSPFASFAIVSGVGGVQEVFPSDWKRKNTGSNFTFTCTDSTVYFWRVAIDSTVLDWRESSFQYIKGKSGWSQAHFFQNKENDFNKLKYSRILRERSFDTLYRKLEVRVYDNASDGYAFSNTDYRIDNQMQDYGACYDLPGLHVVVIDPEDLTPWRTHYGSQNPTHYFGNQNENGACRPRTEGYFIFRHDSTSLVNFENMLNNVIPDGFFYVVYTLKYPQYEYWPSSLFQTFKNLGSDSIYPGRPNRAFIFFGKKGDPNASKEIVASYAGEYLNLVENLYVFDNSGSETSPFIGPSKNWENVYWRQLPMETPTSDTTYITIQGYDKNFIKKTEQNILMTTNDSIVGLNNSIDASLYPYLKLKGDYKDNLKKTPAQLKRWQVTYQPLPEAAIDGKVNGITWIPAKDTLEEGMEIKFAVDIRNISDYPMDSLLINYWVTDFVQGKHTIPFDRKDSLRVNEVFRDTISFSTKGLGGLNTLYVEVNPYVSYGVTDQPEQFHFNNILQKNFFVTQDNVNPILDVTFDGKYIMNGDLVSAKPEILISLKDENEFAIMNDISDTSLFSVYIVTTKGEQKRIPFMDGQGNVIMQWVPATDQSKKCKIIYPANFEENGKYTLIVQGADKNGNLSGDNAYQISFEIIQEATISYLTNYPNPFSSSTRFVYTLTGSKVPDDIQIQIMTMSGKVIKEISAEELGPLEIGRNKITNYAWDGKDNFGDQLANGVYLYRVLTRMNGEEIKHRESSVDTNFTKEFGKIYLFR